MREVQMDVIFKFFCYRAAIYIILSRFDFLGDETNIKISPTHFRASFSACSKKMGIASNSKKNTTDH